MFSPTIDSDEKWDWVKQQKLLVENLPLKKWLKEMSAKKKEDTLVQRAMPAVEFEGLVNPRDGWSPEIPEDHYFNSYDDETFQGIMEEQMGVIRLLKKYKQPKYLANRILIIFDDLVGSALFQGSRGSYFKVL